MERYEILVYTRKPLDDAVYAEKLAYSVHLAVRCGTIGFKSLNHNGGVFYVKAAQDPEDGTLHAKSLANPWMFEQADGSFGIVAVRIETDGTVDESSRGRIVYAVTRNLTEYEEIGLIALPETEAVEDVYCSFDQEKQLYHLVWKNQSGRWKELDCRNLFEVNEECQAIPAKPIQKATVETDIEGAVVRNVLEVEKEIAEYAVRKLTVPVHSENRLPQEVRLSSLEELKKMKVTCVYSDGSSVDKPVDWDVEQAEERNPGVYFVQGLIRQPHFEFPLALDRADPCVTRWQGKYYYIATNDADNNHTLYIREANTLEGLFTAKEVLILDSDTYPHVGNLLWAPEFHEIEGRLYIFHAATPMEFEKEQSHVMCLKEGGNPMNREDWSMPQRVLKKDGSMLYGEQGITLDMTEFEVRGRYYVMWSQRQFFPVDQGAWLYIAEINPKEPWKLISDPVLVSMPEYGWANNHTYVDEGPYAIVKEDIIYVTFSSAAVDSTYVVGMLSAKPDSDLLDPKSWKKINYPKLSCRSMEGEYGTGHNAYVEDEDGLLWNTYHARPGVDGPRSTGVRRVHFDVDGEPILEMLEEDDLRPDLRRVSIQAVIGE